MRFRRALPIAALVLTLAFAVAAAQDGTGGPEFGTPNPDACDRDLISAEAFAEFARPTGEFFSGSLTPIGQGSIEALEPADAETAVEIDETMRSYAACVTRYGAIGAYAFLDPGLELIELIYLGVSGATLDEIEGEDEGTDPFAGITPATNLTPQLVVLLDDGRIGAVVPSPQPGTEFSLLTMVKVEDLWFIERITPLLPEGAGDPGQPGGP